MMTMTMEHWILLLLLLHFYDSRLAYCTHSHFSYGWMEHWYSSIGLGRAKSRPIPFETHRPSLKGTRFFSSSFFFQWLFPTKWLNIIPFWMRDEPPLLASWTTTTITFFLILCLDFGARTADDPQLWSYALLFLLLFAAVLIRFWASLRTISSPFFFSFLLVKKKLHSSVFPPYHHPQEEEESFMFSSS